MVKPLVKLQTDQQAVIAFDVLKVFVFKSLYVFSFELLNVIGYIQGLWRDPIHIVALKLRQRV